MKTNLSFLREISEKMRSFFCESEVEKIARTTKFVQRTSTLRGNVFCQLLLNMFVKAPDGASLEDYVQELKNNYGIDITKEALNQRFNQYSVEFIKTLCNRLLALQLRSVLDLSELKLPFVDIQLLDSTYIQLPDSMSEQYRGTGKKSSKKTSNAGYKWHLEYQLLSNRFIGVITTQGAENDVQQTCTHLSEEQIEENVLYIRDLGYYKMEVFKKIANAGAYFLSRMKRDTTLYQKNSASKFERIDLTKFIQEMQKAGIQQKSIWIYLSKQRIYTRLIIESVPSKVREQRVRKLKKSQKRGYQTKKNTLLLMGYNVFITNVEEKDLSIEKVRMLYSIRWQIELTFKIWKSILKVNHYQKMKQERILVLLYAKLLWILTSSKVLLQIKNMLFHLAHSKKKIEVSAYKLFKTFTIQFAKDFLAALFDAKVNHSKKLLSLLKQLYEFGKKYCKKERKKGHSTPMIILEQITQNNDKQNEHTKTVQSAKHIKKAA